MKNAEHCAAKYHIPKATTDPKDIFNSADVDIVFISVSDEFHEPYAIAALEAQKNVFIEKPITLSMQSAQRIIDAEKKSEGRVWVGYMRRHSRTFTEAFKRELESIPKILYARSRDFSGRMLNLSVSINSMSSDAALLIVPQQMASLHHSQALSLSKTPTSHLQQGKSVTQE